MQNSDNLHTCADLKNESDTTLVFESLFESGNLYQAHQVCLYVSVHVRVCVLSVSV